MKKEIDDDFDDSATITDEMWALARPARDVLTEQFGAAAAESFLKRYRGQRGKGKKSPKEKVTLRLDGVVVARLKAGGRGWQTRTNELLRKALDISSAPTP
ncbi:MAG: BrnA antitoxin family protein [Alphaproteobacteria bacterium]|jgi:uncharacterized protein (DUF4415 family)|nr:BrnA antitoxin family protein [Alphaproteobacteria bacterium]